MGDRQFTNLFPNKKVEKFRSQPPSALNNYESASKSVTAPYGIVGQTDRTDFDDLDMNCKLYESLDNEQTSKYLTNIKKNTNRSPAKNRFPRPDPNLLQFQDVYK